MLRIPTLVSQSFKPMTSERIRKRAVASTFLSLLYKRSSCDPHAFHHATVVLAAACFSVQRSLHSSSRAVRIWEAIFHLCLWLPCLGSRSCSLSCPVPPTLASDRQHPSCAT